VIEKFGENARRAADLGGHEGGFWDVGGVHTGVICAAVWGPAGSLAGR
jgi:hypothetical protein